MSALARAIAKASLAINAPAAGAAMLRDLILQRFPDAPEVITPVHAECARLLVHARMYGGETAALLAVTGAAASVDAAAEWGTGVTDVLHWGHYGGLLHAGAERWDEAVESFKMVRGFDTDLMCGDGARSPALRRHRC